MIRMNRVYSEPSSRDGLRILVDRFWPCGVSKERDRIVAWRKDFAPSASLRKWFARKPRRSKLQMFSLALCLKTVHPP
jgi:uncharacterized protein YeaO (DUF488 family)